MYLNLYMYKNNKFLKNKIADCVCVSGKRYYKIIYIFTDVNTIV